MEYASLRAVRGIRSLVIGAVFLAEELYETGVLVLTMADDATSGAR